MSGRSKARSSRGTRRQPKPKKAEGRRVLWTALLLFALALALRLLFWQARPDADWPHSVHFKGDAPTWAEYAASLRAGTDFELGLPLRPPGAAYLLAALWDPSGDGRSGLGGAQLAWCLLGALTVLLVYDAARRSFGDAVGLIAGLLCAVSHGLMVLSTSLNNETPYLFVVACTLWMWAWLWARRAGPHKEGRLSSPSIPWLCAWGGLHGLACLIRVEHLLFFVLTTAWLVLQLAAATGRSSKSGLRAAARASVPAVLPVLAAFALVLLPWHLQAWQAIERFNTERPDPDSPAEAAQARLEQMLGPVRWTDEAAAERDALPAFARRAAANFVAATKLFRLGRSAPSPLVIEAADLDALDQAFGGRPEPLPEHPFVTFYGGLNFYLAHNPWAEPGFSRAVLDQPPPLHESSGPFPPILVDGLPPPTLAFTYPPHLHAVNHGYALGLRHILAEPAATARRLAQRLVIFWDGASLGFGGIGLPASGDLLRRRADLAVPTGHVIRIWQLAWLGLVLAGLVFGLRRKTGNGAGLGPLVPWLALAATKLVASLAFFGYARHGAGAYPVVALLAALGLVGLARRFGVDLASASLRRQLAVGVTTLGLLILALEFWRFAHPPSLQLDGRSVQSGDPWPIDVHETRRLTH